MTDYSNQAKLLKCDKPFLMFQMPLDSGSQNILGLNMGRLSLWDYEHGLIHRWVATSSHNGKQNWADWEKTGGVHPTNYSMDDAEWFQLETKLIIQPGCPVEEGFLPKYKGKNTWITLKGNTRSEIMFHEDANAISNPGSMGCVVMLKGEWENFKTVFKTCCGHLQSVPYGVLYS
jgi:hypothetical protein